ncbi:pyrroline-5-carboxylate reductase family protein [Amaricoccus solimangrovi]|uniref:NADP oxidoreductase n=1 Tax=Amaricoccus solimangrovi TaxID=2589815 RepID=A0A501W6Y1_9RHOB|nr:NAD(P)-binding domain-containing protein [Amaricoccus solimangrovi]TPE45048.1 NADP oxidoreductase [Amaricoccus solimangrovi]
MRVGIIGATGWLGSALGRRLLSRKLIAPEQLVVLGCGSHRFEYYGYAGVTPAIDIPDLVFRSDVVVLAVRPDAWPRLTPRAEGKLVLSFMAGVSARMLARHGGRIARAMPNAAAEFGASLTPWWAADTITSGDRAVIPWLLSAIGASEEIADETGLDPVTEPDRPVGAADQPASANRVGRPRLVRAVSAAS